MPIDKEFGSRVTENIFVLVVQRASSADRHYGGMLGRRWRQPRPGRCWWFGTNTGARPFISGEKHTARAQVVLSNLLRPVLPLSRCAGRQLMCWNTGAEAQTPPPGYLLRGPAMEKEIRITTTLPNSQKREKLMFWRPNIRTPSEFRTHSVDPDSVINEFPGSATHRPAVDVHFPFRVSVTQYDAPGKRKPWRKARKASKAGQSLERLFGF